MTQSSSGTEAYTQDINNNFAAAKAAIANLASNTAPSSLIQTVNGKQDALTEGPGINISGNTISVSTTIASKTDIGDGKTVFKANGTAFATISANQTSTVNVDYTIPALPTLATVATSGSYNDLSNKPTIPDAQIQSDWNQTTTTAKDYIKNKPSIPAATTESTVSGWGFTKNSGTVQSVNGSTPDANGDVTITIPTVPTVATTVNSSSTNAQTVGAKLFYDTVGNIETLLSEV